MASGKSRSTSKKEISAENTASAMEMHKKEINRLKEIYPITEYHTKSFDPQKYGERIQICRQKKGYSLQKCGSLAGMTGVTLHNIENGLVKRLNQDRLYLLCSVFSVTPDYLLGLTDSTNKTIEVQSDGSTKELRSPFDFGEDHVSQLATELSTTWGTVKNSYTQNPDLCRQLLAILQSQNPRVKEMLCNRVEEICKQFKLNW